MIITLGMLHLNVFSMLTYIMYVSIENKFKHNLLLRDTISQNSQTYFDKNHQT